MAANYGALVYSHFAWGVVLVKFTDEKLLRKSGVFFVGFFLGLFTGEKKEKFSPLILHTIGSMKESLVTNKHVKIKYRYNPLFNYT